MADTTVYLPRQHTNRGTAGYKGRDVVVVDTETGHQEPAATKAKPKTAPRVVGKAGVKTKDA